MGILGPDFVGHGKNLREPFGFDSRISANLFQRRQNLFGGDIAHQIIPGKRAAPKAGERAVESAATRFVGRHNFFLGTLRPAVEVHTEFDSRHVILHFAIEIADKLGIRRADGVETVRTRISFSHSNASCTISGPQGSSYGFPNAMET